MYFKNLHCTFVPMLAIVETLGCMTYEGFNLTVYHNKNYYVFAPCEFRLRNTTSSSATLPSTGLKYPVSNLYMLNKF